MERVCISRDVLILIRDFFLFWFGGGQERKEKPLFFTNSHYTQQGMINDII